MKTRLDAVMGQQRGDRERGAATLEGVGMYAVAAVLAVAVLLASLTAAPAVADKIRQAIGMVTTLGQGPCDSSLGAADNHKPTVPCVVTANGHTGAVEAGALVTIGGNEQFLVEKLNNGMSRVTRGTGSSVGVAGGVGANISATWNSKTVGGALSADVNAAVNFSAGEVYYANNNAEIADILSAHKEDVVKDVMFSGSPIGAFRSLVDKAEEAIGVGSQLPPPDEVYVTGAVSMDAKAQATWVTANAEAAAGIQSVLGTRVGTDGTSTTYYQASLDGKVGAGTWATHQDDNQLIYSKAAAEGRVEGVIEVDRDSSHAITAVRVKSVLAGTAEATSAGGAVDEGPRAASYTEGVLSLPIRTVTDQVVAQRYLNALGMGVLGGFKGLPKGTQSYLPIVNPLDIASATKGFGEAVVQRGVVTRQTFNDSESGSYDAVFDVEALAKIGGSVKVDVVGRRSTGAQYRNGSMWETWKGCVQ